MRVQPRERAVRRRVRRATTRPAPFSNYGDQTVDVFAPGVDILATTNPTAGYGFKSGTSMADAARRGLAALLLARNPKLTVAQIKPAIVGTVDNEPALAGIPVRRPGERTGRPRPR